VHIIQLAEDYEINIKIRSDLKMMMIIDMAR